MPNSDLINLVIDTIISGCLFGVVSGTIIVIFGKR